MLACGCGPVRLGVCQVDFMIDRGRAATTDGIARKWSRSSSQDPTKLPGTDALLTMRTTMAAMMLLPTCAAYQLAGARPVVHAMAPMGSGRTSVELAATYIQRIYL